VTLRNDVLRTQHGLHQRGNPRAALPTPEERYATTLVRRGATIGAATMVCGIAVGEAAFIMTAPS
jgi:hypothetical protein